MLKVVIAIGLAIGAMVGVVALLGARLPVSHVATRSVVIAAPPTDIFAAISDFSSASSWRGDVKSMSVTTDSATGRLRVTEVSSSGTMTMEVEQVMPPMRLVTRIVGDGLPYGGAWAYRLEPQGSSTRVTITEHGEVYHPVFRFISNYLIGHTGTLETYLTNLGRKFGTDVTPADADPVPLTL
jgi:uncharacterized protein YndB with AHSA1/START domain